MDSKILELKNWSLLAKWWWRYGEEKEALWRRIIVSKYREDVWRWVPKRVHRYRLFGLCDSLESHIDYREESEWDYM